MALHDSDIAKAWATFQAPKMVKKFFQKVGAFSGGWSGGGGAPLGTIRFSFDEAGRVYSYKMLLGLRGEDARGRYLLLNADGAPSMRTRAHQGELRDAAGRSGTRAGLVPFSVLSRAAIQPQEVHILEVGADYEIVRTRIVGGIEKKYSVHFLGELLFQARDRYWLSGLDRNDDPRKRVYYLCQLPKPASTIEGALNSLRPPELPAETPRQGEWFFQPTDQRFPLREKLTRVPIHHQDPQQQPRMNGEIPWDRQDRHVAQDMIIRPEGVFVRRTIRDDEHQTLNLGMRWHRVIRNLSEVGYRYDAQGGTRVD